MRHLMIKFNQEIKMRDNIKLFADIYFPPDYSGLEKYPVILMRTPYLKNTIRHIEDAKFFAYHDYVFVFQDVRGRGDSEGVFRPFFNEKNDGFDTIEWIAEQEWCNGKIGMEGASYMAYGQWAAAKAKPPHLKTIVSSAAGGKFMEELPFFNGVPSLSMMTWVNSIEGKSDQNHAADLIDWPKVFSHVPINEIDKKMYRNSSIWAEWMAHPKLDDYWKTIRLNEQDFSSINLPVLHITGWYDGDQPGALFFYENMINFSPKSNQQYLLIGPWSHKGTRYPTKKLWGQFLSDKAVIDIYKIHLDWFDYWLKNKSNVVEKWAKTKYYILNENIWQESSSTWPIYKSRPYYYLHSDGNANSIKGTGILSRVKPEIEPPDKIVYNPKKIGEDYIKQHSSKDSSESELRKQTSEKIKYKVQIVEPKKFITDEEGSMNINAPLSNENVLIYTTDKMKTPLKIVGTPYIEFFASSDCLDTDWFAGLCDVYPDGQSIFITNKIFRMVRARFRNTLEQAELLTPNKIYKYRISLGSIAISIPVNHQIRLFLSNHAFPDWARNHNTGNDIVSDIDFKIATNRIYHDSQNLSCLYLPVVDHN